MRPPTPRGSRVPPTALVAALLAWSCGGDSPASPDPDPGGCNSAQDLASCLPSWQEYAPPQQEQAPALDAESAPREETAPLERIDDTGNTVLIGNVAFVCTDRTFRFVDNPDRAMSFSIDETKLWPGALIQGRTHRDGGSIGAIEELPIEERSPVTLTITFNNDDNTRVIDVPNSGSVRAALGSMIGHAEAEGLATANTIDYQSRTYSSEKQAAVEFGMSGRYLAFEATASGSISTQRTMNTVAAKFVQQMYVAGVRQPSTPAAFFSSAFTPAKYQEHAALKRIGPANPPLYVSRIGYGRMMMFAMSAKAEVSEIQGALQASYNGVAASGGAQLDARQQAILRESQIRITQVGGDQGNALAAIRSGRLGDYFTDRAPLTSATPLWFELKTLDGKPTLVSEPGTFTETTCVPRLPGTFDYLPEAQLAIPFTAGTQRQTLEADVNDDGRMDLIFNERRSAPSMNRVHVALGQVGGGFALTGPADNPQAPAEGWENYQMLVADYTGDGRDDLVWNHRGTSNVVYAAASEGGGAFAFGERQVHVNQNWGGYAVRAADMNGDGRTDLVWNTRTATLTRTYFGLAQSDGTLSMIANQLDRAGNFSGYGGIELGRFNGDAYADLVLSSLGPLANTTYVGRFAPASATTGTLTWGFHARGSGWPDYRLLIGDIDGANAMDLMWVRSDAVRTVIHRSFNSGSATFTNAPAYQEVKMAGAVLPYAADFNDDGRIDLLLNKRTSDANELIVGYGTASGDFSFPAGPQEHTETPTVGWEPFDQVFVGDVNGDGKADIVWTSPSSDARIYVALAK